MKILAGQCESLPPKPYQALEIWNSNSLRIGCEFSAESTVDGTRGGFPTHGTLLEGCLVLFLV